MRRIAILHLFSHLFHPSLSANDGAAKDTARIITERPAHPFSAQSWMSSEGPPLVAISPLEGLAAPEGVIRERENKRGKKMQ